MKVIVSIVLAVVAIGVAVGAGWFFLSRSLPGGGKVGVVIEQRALPAFSRLVIEGLAEVTLVQGAAESATVEATSKQVRSVVTEVRDQTLWIKHEQSRRWWSDFLGGGVRPAKVTVNYREIDAIDASGGVRLRADRIKTDRLKISASGATAVKIGDLDVKELVLGGSGAMKVDLVGRATTQTVSISGAADYRAADLVSEDARVSVSGAGRVLVQAEKTLTIDLSGAGSVEYIGNPKITQQISGVGRVKRRDAMRASPLVAYAESLSPPSGP